MLRKLLTVIAILIIGSSAVFAQGGGTIKGTVTKDGSGEPIPFANVVLFKGSSQVMGTSADFDGKYILKPIPPGVYDLQISVTGFSTRRISGIEVSAGKILQQNAKITEGVELDVVNIDYERPLIELDKSETGKTFTSKEIERMAVRTLAGVSRNAGNGVTGRDNGSGTINGRGQRGNSNVTFIDGVKVIGSVTLPQSAIEEISIKTGGLSAQYGDATGVVRTIATKSGFTQYFGGLEFFSSGFKVNENESFGLDKWGSNTLALNFGGPLLAKKDENGKVTESILSFFLTSELRSNLSGPSSTRLVKPKDDVETLIRENPYFFNDELNIVQQRAEFLSADDFEEIDYRKNGNSKGAVINGKFDLRLTEFSTFTFGGTVNYGFSNNYARGSSLFNYENHSETQSTDYRVWGRYVKRFENEEPKEGETGAVVKNAFFQIQADFSRFSSQTQDPGHKENVFDYGYVGRFDANTQLTYGPGQAVLSDGRVIRGQFLTAFDGPISYDYTPGDKNPILANYTSDFYSFIPQGDQRRRTRLDVEGAGGIVNGAGAPGVYGLWTSAGMRSGGFSKVENDQIRLSGMGSADIGGHAILLGFEYEQRIQRSYSVGARGLWDLGRQLVNSHIDQIDSTNFSVGFQHPNPIQPTVTFERQYNGDQRSYFAYNVRRALGFDPNGTTFIDFDSYDPSLYNLDYFAADQLLNPANPGGVAMQGFSKTGKKLSTSTTLEDFFNEEISDGTNSFKTRPVAPYEPIYIAGFIEDKFTFDDLIVRVGLRLDRFDANQPALKDRFSLFPTRKVAYVKTTDPTFETDALPSNIGDDFVVYVDDIENPSTDGIVGYRDPSSNRFFNAIGQELNDPTVLESGSRITPWLVNPGNKTESLDLNAKSFEDYEPQYVLMPRVSFSFPISDEATFFANYDIKTQRPRSASVFNPTAFLFFTQQGGGTINNPNLEPTRTISYEIGFKQKLTNFSALTLGANYNEQRDEIQIRRVVGAFPVDYSSFDNIDFGTVKGFNFEYELRTRKNIYFNIKYTLQFAEGTGSSATTSASLINSGQPNLRSVFPFSYDSRHNIVTILDYRYGSGRRYNGPKLGGKDVLANTGINLSFRAVSGTPYTARSAVISNVGASTSSGTSIGDVNGSRLPWTMSIDARLDKQFPVKFGKKTSNMVVYLQVFNVLDRRNIQGVNPFTGNPNDDGFLNAPEFQQFIRQQNNEQSYRDLYTLAIDNPGSFELPRRMRLGIQLSF